MKWFEEVPVGVTWESKHSAVSSTEDYLVRVCTGQGNHLGINKGHRETGVYVIRGIFTDHHISYDRLQRMTVFFPRRRGSVSDKATTPSGDDGAKRSARLAGARYF